MNISVALLLIFSLIGIAVAPTHSHVHSDAEASIEQIDHEHSDKHDHEPSDDDAHDCAICKQISTFVLFEGSSKSFISYEPCIDFHFTTPHFSVLVARGFHFFSLRAPPLSA
jgi:hypothetical protein